MTSKLPIICDATVLRAGEALSELGFENFQLLAEDEIVPGGLGDAEALIVRSGTRVNAELIEGSKLRFLATATVGEDHVDRRALDERGIDFVSAAGSSAVSVSQFALGQMAVIAEGLGRELDGFRLGVVGCGRIGSRVAAAAERLGMEVMRFDPPLADLLGSPAFRPLEEAAACDMISLHVPLTRSGEHPTIRMIDESFLEMLPAGSVLLNCARGDVVEPRALEAARRAERVAGLALDVFPEEPACDASLVSCCDLPTPHVGGRSMEGMLANTRSTLRALCAHFGQEWQSPDCLVEKTVEMVGVDREDGPASFVQKAWALFAPGLAMREATELPATERALSFRNLRRPPYRRDLTSLVVEGEISPALRRFLDALSRR